MEKSAPPAVVARAGVLRYSQSVRLPRLALVVATALATPALGCRLKTEQPPVAADVTAPDFVLTAHDGQSVSLDELLASGPAILVFYRGHW